VEEFPTMTRDQMKTIVAERARGAREAVDPCRVFDKDGTYLYFNDDANDLDMCLACAEKLLERREIETDRLVEMEGDESDTLHFCGGCGAPIDEALTRSGAADELEHWEDHGLPSTPDDWSEFLRMVNGLDEALLPRVDALLQRVVSA
jgi:hypothetical protein